MGWGGLGRMNTQSTKNLNSSETTLYDTVIVDTCHYQFVPGGSDGKESACSAGDLGLIPGKERPPGEGNGYPLQYSCLGNPLDTGAWRATVHGVTKSQTQLRTNTFTFIECTRMQPNVSDEL